MSDVASHPPAQHGQPASDPIGVDARPRLPLSARGKRIATSQRAALITLSQILPPMLLLLVFSSHGPALWFFLPIPVVCALVSFVLLPFKLVRLERHKRYLLRPILTIAISSTLIGIAFWSYSIAERQFESTARIIEVLCKVQDACPASLPGWQETREGVYRSKVGTFIRYPITYYHEGGRGFGLRLYQSLRMERYYTNVKNSPAVQGRRHRAFVNEAALRQLLWGVG